MHELSRDEYETKCKDGHAGTADTLDPETVDGFKQRNPTWKGEHWMMYQGPTVGPVNVADESPFPTVPLTPELAAFFAEQDQAAGLFMDVLNEMARSVGQEPIFKDERDGSNGTA